MKSGSLRLVSPTTAGKATAQEEGWLAWLGDHIDDRWRPGEWDQELWLFTGDLGSDRTSAWKCRTPGCPIAASHYNGRCSGCRRARVTAGCSEEEFDRQPRRQPIRPIERGVCSVPDCRSELHSRGLCFRHERAWRRTGEPVTAFIVGAEPLERLESCLVAGCGRERVDRRGLCGFHVNRLRRQGHLDSLSEHDLAAWVAAEKPRIGAHQFSLAPLSPLVRLELLYGLQHRDTTPPPLDPLQVRILVSRVADASSLRHVDPEVVCESGGVQYNSAIKGLLRDLRRYVERASVHYSGADPYSGDLWEVALLDLQSNGSRRWPATAGVVDFGSIELAWLREVIKDWGRSTRPYLQALRQALRACCVVSHTLVASGRTDPASLGTGDFTLVVQVLSEQRGANGNLHSASYRNQLIRLFCEVVEHGRRSGLMAEVPDPFRPTVRRHRVIDEPNEEHLGKALPESVIRQLDEHLDLLGPLGSFGSMSAADLQKMYQSIYKILRDTGRRPGEVASLKRGCIEVAGGQHQLIYDNHKAGRMRRRLPITAETAEVIVAWESRRVQLSTPPATSPWLFPSPMLRSHQSLGHLTAAGIGLAFRLWLRRIPTIDSEVLGPDGTPLPFDRLLAGPYAFRHSYAQRHADAGVPVDVLRDLMDHVSIQTTSGYYAISFKRKQEAIRSVGSLAVDASGNPAPFSDAVAYERASVSVPFGNCTEPSNVKAGGGHCPIRFQCAGCGFYRPDPSFLPALEEHIAGLRADKETAMAIGAAGYVIANMSGEVDAFARIAEKMHRRLGELDPQERAEVEQASTILRRVRAGRRIPLVASLEAKIG